MYWWPATDGIYTTKSGYWLARMGHVRGWTDRFGGDRAETWNSIWNLDGPPKLRQFVWRACTGSLATFGRLQQRHVRTDGMCSLCNEQQESIVHAIFFCSNVKQVWDLSPFAELICKAPCDSFFELYEWMKGKVGSSELLTFVAYAWATWSYRNSVVFENPWQCRDVGVLGFLRLVKDYKSYATAVNVCPPAAVSRSTWKAPSAGLIRVNSDAAVISETSSSIGAVLRNDQGVIVPARVKRFMGKPPVKVLEAMAARMGVQTARELGFSKVELESDALSVINLIKSHKIGKAPVDLVVDDIRSMSMDFESFFLFSY
ncbi:uncharacterized protein LOC110690413 [Chenopodium quinoa]|uniref:uncharacterized protein LOC110690413 n=1 Tax=Chenopodium quinoa TaxID=63459 RepID=UPI000B78A5EB|nr:uncharacterized protein LOC110690413 [Chenopodium quinoa]